MQGVTFFEYDIVYAHKKIPSYLTEGIDLRMIFFILYASL